MFKISVPYINFFRFFSQDLMLFGFTRSPAFPSNKISRHADTSLAIIGTFAAIASINTFPNPSDSVVEKAKISASPSILATLFVVPTNISSGFKESFNERSQR